MGLVETGSSEGSVLYTLHQGSDRKYDVIIIFTAFLLCKYNFKTLEQGIPAMHVSEATECY